MNKPRFLVVLPLLLAACIPFLQSPSQPAASPSVCEPLDPPTLARLSPSGPSWNFTAHITNPFPNNHNITVFTRTSPSGPTNRKRTFTPSDPLIPIDTLFCIDTQIPHDPDLVRIVINPNPALLGFTCRLTENPRMIACQSDSLLKPNTAYTVEVFERDSRNVDWNTSQAVKRASNATFTTGDANFQ